MLLLLPLLASAALATPGGLVVNTADADFITAGFATTAGFGGVDLTERRLVEFEGQAPVWITELEKIQAKARGLRSFDVTDTPDLGAGAALRAAQHSPLGKPSHSEIVKPILDSLSIEGPIENLQKFTSFRTRYYRSETGKQSQQWLLGRIGEITAQYAPNALREEVITISEFPHSWGQNSIIVRINGSKSDETVIVSAHQDSTNMFPFLPAPGADDDGSGTVTILEAYRGVLESGFAPARALEFHWYAAEEGGLLGSQAVVKEYAARDAPVVAQIQFDMTAWLKKGTKEVIGILEDFVDRDLTEYLKQLVEAYIDVPWAGTKCGYGCSDHASWNKAGYRASSPAESLFEDTDNHIHSGNDRIDISTEFSFPHLLHFAKLAAAFAVELTASSK